MKTTHRTRPRRLICCCCGSGTMGRQWWNRDTGYGLCGDCIGYVGVADVPFGKEARSYGIRGTHWDITAMKTVHWLVRLTNPTNDPYGENVQGVECIHLAVNQALIDRLDSLRAAVKAACGKVSKGLRAVTFDDDQPPS